LNNFEFVFSFNHSCDPNITRNFDGQLYAVSELEERQKKLLDQYFFQCHCVCCEEKWPLYKEIPETDWHLIIKYNPLKCSKCKENGGRCVDCENELDNAMLVQVTAQQALKLLLNFDSSIDINDKNTRIKLSLIYEQFATYLKLLEKYKVKKPTQDYNNYEEPFKQCLNLIYL
jgi:hypothetical protein